MRILYYTQTYFLDCDLPLIKALQEKGHEIYLFIDLPYYQLHSTIININEQRPEVKILSVHDYPNLSIITSYIEESKVYILNRPCHFFNLKNIKLRWNFYQEIRKIRPDIIHCTEFIDIADIFLYAFNKKIVQIVHDPFPHTGEKTIKKYVVRFLAYKIIKRFVLLNEKQREMFMSKNKISPTHIYHSNLGVYSCLHWYKNNNNIIGDDVKYILFIGRISPYKGIEYLIDAMDKIHRENSSVKLVIAGSGKMYFKDKLENKSYIITINRYLMMYDMYSLLCRAEVVVCPYIDATQSGVIMSAYAMNCPVIATKVGGLPEMIDDGKSGFIVPVRDIHSLYQSILELFTNPENLQYMRTYIKKLNTEGRFSWSQIASRYEEIYNSLD